MASKTQGRARSKGTGSIKKKGNRFYFRVRVDGEEKSTLLRDSEGKPVTTRPAAEKAAEALMPILHAKSEEDIAEYILETKKMQSSLILPLEDVWETYLAQSSRPDSGPATLAKYQGILRMFLDWLQKIKPPITHLSETTERLIQDYFAILSKKQITGRTYNGHRQALHLIYKHLLPIIEFERNPLEKIATRTKDSVSRRDFTEEQVEAIFKGFADGFFYDTEVEKLTTGRKRERVKASLEFKPMHAGQLKVLLYLCCYTGCRGQDGCLMRWSNVNLRHNHINYMPRKTARTTGKEVTIPLHPDLYQALQEAEQWRETNKSGQDYIIPAVANRYQYNPGGIQKDVMKIIRCATGLETKTDETPGKRVLKANLYSLHSFRHTFVSFCANAGVSLDIVAQVVGHGAPAMTRHYAHISSEAKQAIIQALPSQGASEENAQTVAKRKELQLMFPDLAPDKIEEMLKIATHSLIDS